MSVFGGDAANHPIKFGRDREKPSLCLQFPAAKLEERKRSGEGLKMNVTRHKQGKGGKILIKEGPKEPQGEATEQSIQVIL